MAKKKIEMDKPEYPMAIATFRQIGTYDLSSMKDTDPSCFNYKVNFRKYRVTVELIDEPLEVLAERLEKLWVQSDNHHHWQPLKAAAASIGYTFKGECGSQRKTKTY